jgi:hypothetical protein
MSAFICGPDHFKALAIFAAERGRHGRNVDPRYVEGCAQLELYRDLELASAYADILYAENIRSVLKRYPNDDEESAPGPIEKPKNIKVTARDAAAPKYKLKPVDLLKMCDCLEYQSCETKDWETTPAYRLLNAIRKAAIHALPGYEDAPWDFYADEARAA